MPAKVYPVIQSARNPRSGSRAAFRTNAGGTGTRIVAAVWAAILTKPRGGLAVGDSLLHGKSDAASDYRGRDGDAGVDEEVQVHFPPQCRP